MISHALYDAWKIKPPCELNKGDCHPECPYYQEAKVTTKNDVDIIMLDELIYSKKERSNQ